MLKSNKYLYLKSEGRAHYVTSPRFFMKTILPPPVLSGEIPHFH